MPPRTSPKKDAVLAIGLDKPTADIVAAAKGRGVEVSATYVDLLKKGVSSGRPKKAASSKKPSAAKAPQATPTKATAKAPPSAVVAKTTSPRTKTDYVRGLGDMKPAAIVEQGRRDGVKLSLAYVYNIRRDSKRAGADSAPAVTIVKRTSPAKVVHAILAPTAVYQPGPDDTEKTMRAAVLAVVLEHGLNRARGVVDAVVAKLRAVVERG